MAYTMGFSGVYVGKLIVASIKDGKKRSSLAFRCIVIRSQISPTVLCKHFQVTCTHVDILNPVNPRSLAEMRRWKMENWKMRNQKAPRTAERGNAL